MTVPAVPGAQLPAPLATDAATAQRLAGSVRAVQPRDLARGESTRCCRPGTAPICRASPGQPGRRTITRLGCQVEAHEPQEPQGPGDH